MVRALWGFGVLGSLAGGSVFHWGLVVQLLVGVALVDCHSSGEIYRQKLLKIGHR